MSMYFTDNIVATPAGPGTPVLPDKIVASPPGQSTPVPPDMVVPGPAGGGIFHIFPGPDNTPREMAAGGIVHVVI